MPAAGLIGRPGPRGPAAAPDAGSSDRRWRYILLAPALFVLAALTILPLVELVAMSAHQISWSAGRARWIWVGLENYAGLLNDELFRQVSRTRRCSRSSASAFRWSWRWRWRS